jgi:hypothetical protein
MKNLRSKRLFDKLVSTLNVLVLGHAESRNVDFRLVGEAKAIDAHRYDLSFPSVTKAVLL